MRKVVLKGPKPFDPGAQGSANHRVKIGTDKTNRKGEYEIPAPVGGSLNAGQYFVTVKKKDLGRANFSGGFQGICLSAAASRSL